MRTAGTMKHKITRDLYAYWQVLRRDRPAPERTEIEPAEIRSILGDTFILEVTDDLACRFRLAGTRICALYGRELKGRAFATLWTGKDRETIGSLIGAISEEAAAAVIGFSGETDFGRSVPIECLLLPLSQNGGGYRRILGSLVAMDDPYWLGMHPVMRQSITGLRLIWPEENRMFLRRGDAAAAETPVRAMPVPLMAPPGATPRRIAHLTVYEGGKS
jgi:hypothetical protein